MRLSKKRLSIAIKKEILASFYQLIADIKNYREAEIVCDSLLSKAEKIAIAKRLDILWALSHGKKYSEIRERLNISPATISKLQLDLKKSGAQKILEKLAAEKWAAAKEEKIKNFFDRLLK